MCHSQPETVEHNISGCKNLPEEKYCNRHSQLAVQLNLNIHKLHDIKVDAQSCYEHNLNKLIESYKVAVLWKFKITTETFPLTNQI